MEELTDVLHLCRLCLVGDEVNVPIFEEQDKREVLLKISTCLPVKVSQEDDLPKKICNSCSNKLDTMLTFRNTSADSEKKLLEWLRRKESKKESAPDDNVISDGDKDVENNESDESKNERVTNIWVKSFEELKKTSLIQNQSATSREKVSKITNEHKSSSSNSAKGQKRAFSSVSEGTCDSDIVESKIPKTELEGDAENVNSTRPGFIDAASQIINQSGLSTTGTNDDNLKSIPTFDFETLSSEFQWICLKCTKLFETEDQLMFHMETHAPVKNEPFECSVCGVLFETLNCLRRHVGNTHNMEDNDLDRLECSYCKRSYPTKAKLNAHLAYHKQQLQQGKSIWVCDICGKVLASVKSLREHIAAHKGLKRLTCHVCGKGFIKACNLTVHLRVHTGEKPYICSVCHKSFTQSTTLVIHRRKHTGEKPFLCDLCQERFISRHALNAHKKSKHKTLNYVKTE